LMNSRLFICAFLVLILIAAELPHMMVSADWFDDLQADDDTSSDNPTQMSCPTGHDMHNDHDFDEDDEFCWKVCVPFKPRKFCECARTISSYLVKLIHFHSFNFILFHS
jgi:hypothetical protein